mgnify:CR=1 FL=1
MAKSYFRKSRYNGDSVVFFANVLPGSLEEGWCRSVVSELNSSLGLKVKLKLGTYNEKLISIQNGESKMWFQNGSKMNSYIYEKDGLDIKGGK